MNNTFRFTYIIIVFTLLIVAYASSGYRSILTLIFEKDISIQTTTPLSQQQHIEEGSMRVTTYVSKMN